MVVCSHGGGSTAAARLPAGQSERFPVSLAPPPAPPTAPCRRMAGLAGARPAPPPGPTPPPPAHTAHPRLTTTPVRRPRTCVWPPPRRRRHVRGAAAGRAAGGTSGLAGAPPAPRAARHPPPPVRHSCATASALLVDHCRGVSDAAVARPPVVRTVQPPVVAEAMALVYAAATLSRGSHLARARRPGTHRPARHFLPSPSTARLFLPSSRDCLHGESCTLTVLFDPVWCWI